MYGALVNNVWSVGSSDSESYNNGLIQPFLNYNFHGGLYLTSSPILTVDWKADSGEQWTVPPVNTQLSSYYNVVAPEYAANWQIRAQLQLMFPK